MDGIICVTEKLDIRYLYTVAELLRQDHCRINEGQKEHKRWKMNRKKFWII